MTQSPVSRLTLSAGILFAVTGIMHGLGLTWATGLAAQGPKDLADAVPALWLGLSVAMIVVGALLVVEALTPGPAQRTILTLAAALPLAEAVLLVVKTGPIGPVYIFAFVGVLALVAAWRAPTT